MSKETSDAMNKMLRDRRKVPGKALLDEILRRHEAAEKARKEREKGKEKPDA